MASRAVRNTEVKKGGGKKAKPMLEDKGGDKKGGKKDAKKDGC